MSTILSNGSTGHSVSAPPVNRLPRETPKRAGGSGVLVRLLGMVPSLLAFGVLGGMLYWGVVHHWSLPKFSALKGESEPVPKAWCEEHSVPEAECVECNSDLLPRAKKYGWCKTHGVHECPLCHPEMAQLDKPFEVTREMLERSQAALSLTERRINNSKCVKHQRRIQFASRDAVEQAGIEVEPVWTGPVSEFVAAPGEIGYDPTLTARASSKAPGTVFRAFKRLGDRVAKGELLALIDAGEVGRLKGELLQAIAQERLKTKTLASMRQSQATVAGRAIVEAESQLSVARIQVSAAAQGLINLGLEVDPKSLAQVGDEELPERLRFLGLPPSQVTEVKSLTGSTNLLPVFAPLDGVVTSREVVAGEVIDPTKTLFVVTDPSRMWVTLDVRLEEAERVRIGGEVRFLPDGSKQEAGGKIAWIGTEADPKTRTVKVRAELDNPAGKLRSNTFGQGRIILREEPKAVVVPNGAVHSDGCCSVVFVRDRDYFRDGAPKIFHVRTVRLGVRNDRSTEIIAGVLPGELVAVKGSAALRGELLKGAFGEGCECCK